SDENSGREPDSDVGNTELDRSYLVSNSDDDDDGTTSPTATPRRSNRLQKIPRDLGEEFGMVIAGMDHKRRKTLTERGYDNAVVNILRDAETEKLKRKRPAAVLLKCGNTLPRAWNPDSRKRPKTEFKPCLLRFCEQCLIRSYKTSWVDAIKSPATVFKCPRCLNACRCLKCSEKRLRFDVPITTLPTSDHAQSDPLIFNDPSLNPLNRGGYDDPVQMVKTFEPPSRDLKQK
ncbi:hypothetical protein BGW38_002353, partial [Lunasporangiospora selenospora]